MTLGGKAGRAPASRFFLKVGEPVSKESVPPLADDLPWCIEPRTNDVVAEAESG